MPSKNKLDRKSATSKKPIGISSDMTFITDSAEYTPPRFATMNIKMYGDPPDTVPYLILVLYNGSIILDGAWYNESELALDAMPFNLNDKVDQKSILSNPIIILIRVVQTKSSKDDPLVNSDNRAGGTVDLLPLLMGQEEVFTNLRFVTISTGECFGTCQATVHITSPGKSENLGIPLILTMKSAHCMPPAKDGTVYVSAVGLTDIHDPKAINFGMSLSNPDARFLVWASCSNAGQGANSAYNLINDDVFIPEDLNPKGGPECPAFYWNAVNRVLVDAEELFERLSKPFLIDVAGVPRSGKVEVRGRYMGWVDARALLEPGQSDTTVAVKLFFYDELRTFNTGGLLSLPPTSAKAASARETDMIFDEMGHNAYVIVRLDLTEPLMLKTNVLSLYDTLGFLPPENCTAPVYRLESYIKTIDPQVDVRLVRKSASALAVHKELCDLARRGSVPMSQSIKRSAANQLLVRVRTMLKNFPPGSNISYIDWQDTMTGQHAAGRRAVTASFAPQPPPARLPDKTAVSRCKVAEDNRIAQKHISANLKVAGRHPRSLICKALRCLEQRNDLDAKNYLFEALSSQPNNRYLLWLLGAQEFDKGTEAEIIASAAFQIATEGDFSDGTANSIAWAALHTFYHTTDNLHGAYVAIRKMRKSFSLPVEWSKFLKRWIETSGEEEAIWDPSLIVSHNPMLITAAFFLCLRCYKFCESILNCVENECDKRGTTNLTIKPSVEKYYLWAALLVLRNQSDRALEVTKLGVKEFGPSGLMSQMYLTCLSTQDWNPECEAAFQEAERSGVKMTPVALYKSALARFKLYPHSSLQRAARAHEMSPSGFTALLLGRIYATLGEDTLALRWCAVAVKVEPYLADGWALLSLFAMYERDIDKARAMLRTARQVGPISKDIVENLEKYMNIIQLEKLSDSLIKNIFIQKQ